MTRFLIIGDLHGNKPLISTKDFDAIIAPGDFCSDKGIREYIQAAYKQFLQNPENYKEWYDLSGKIKAKKLIKNSMKKGREILEFLNSFEVPVYVVPGNWDLTGSKDKWKFLVKNYYKSYLIKGLKNVKDLHNKLLQTKEFQLIGYGICNGPELYKYRGYKKIKKKESIENKEKYNILVKKYNALFIKLNKKKPVLFITHNVPFNTKLDKITDKKSLRYGYHYGSVLARDIILKHKPLVCIGGHIHEHFGKDKLGKTTIINAGFGSNVNTILEIKDNKITKLKFIKKKINQN